MMLVIMMMLVTQQINYVVPLNLWFIILSHRPLRLPNITHSSLQQLAFPGVRTSRCWAASTLLTIGDQKPVFQRDMAQAFFDIEDIILGKYLKIPDILIIINVNTLLRTIHVSSYILANVMNHWSYWQWNIRK